MEMRELGQSGIDVSKICLGTMTWGQQNTEAEGHAQIGMALEYGVNFLDTAELYSVPARAETYGSTERILGSWLKKNGNRDSLVIASKIAGPAPHLSYMRPHLNEGQGNSLDRQSVIEACDASLKRLGTDYLDLYQVHWPARKTNYFGVLRYRPAADENVTSMEETLSAMKELVDAGKIRAVGLSNETAWGVMHALKLSDSMGLPRVASVQNPYNFLNRSYEIGLAELADKENCGLLAYSPTASGYLTGKYCNGAVPANSRFGLFKETFGRYVNQQGTAAMERYVALACEHNWDPAQMALTFVNIQPFVTSNIIGATNLDQLKNALDTHDMTLPRDLIKQINKIEAEFPMPCP